MPIRTRSDMHIGLDLNLEILNATPSNRMDAAIKDFFLNRTITEFVKSVITRANEPDENKRVPARILTYGDVLRKYNDIATLITINDTILPETPTDLNWNYYNFPSNLFRFETSYSVVKPLSCVLYNSLLKATYANSTGAGTVTAGDHYYSIVFRYTDGSTEITSDNVSKITVSSNKNVEITNIPLPSTNCIAREVYRTKANDPWYNMYYVASIGLISTSYTDSKTDAQLVTAYTNSGVYHTLTNLLLNTYDIIDFNNNPFGGKRKYIGTIIVNNNSTTPFSNTGLRLYHLQRYLLSRIGFIYIRKPAILTSSPTVVDCDLPESVHDEIIDNTAKYIAAAVSSGNYEQLVTEAKLKMQ